MVTSITVGVGVGCWSSVDVGDGVTDGVPVTIVTDGDVLPELPLHDLVGPVPGKKYSVIALEVAAIFFREYPLFLQMGILLISDGAVKRSTGVPAKNSSIKDRQIGAAPSDPAI